MVTAIIDDVRPSSRKMARLPIANSLLTHLHRVVMRECLAANIRVLLSPLDVGGVLLHTTLCYDLVPETESGHVVELPRL